MHGSWRVAVVVALAAAATFVGCGGADEGVALPDDAETDAVAAATALCPRLWDWVLQIGDDFNDAAADVATIDDAAGRRERWALALETMQVHNDALAADLAPLADDASLAPILAPIVADMDDGFAASTRALDDIAQLFEDDPSIDEGRHQDRTSQVIVRVEKVIDVVKPELSDYDTDGTLVAAFRQVPECQHAVKDVDDGTPRYNG